MVWLGVKPELAKWKAQTNPLSYGSTRKRNFWLMKLHKQSRQK